VAGILGALDFDLGDEGDAIEVGETAQDALRLRRLAHVGGIEAECRIDHGAEGAFGDLPADRDAMLVHLAALDGEHLPELAPGMRALGYRELAVEHEHVAAGRVRGLEQTAIDLGLAIRATLADRHRHLGEGAVRDELAGLLGLGVVHVEGHGDHPFVVALILERRAPRSGASVTSRRPERSLAGRPNGLPARQTRRRVSPRSGSCRQPSPSTLKKLMLMTWSTMPGSSRPALPPSICGCQTAR